MRWVVFCWSKSNVPPKGLRPDDVIVCADSGAADALSTALFLLPLEEGRALLAQYDAEAMWVDADGEIFKSDGFEKLIRT